MKRAETTVILSGSVEQVWELVTDNRHYAWRSDLSKIEVSEDGGQFIEYTKKGLPRFTITEKKPPERYAFEMENQYFTGRWNGVFSSTAGGGTKLILTEEITGKNMLSKLMLGLFFNLTKMQRRYLTALQMELSKK